MNRFRSSPCGLRAIFLFPSILKRAIRRPAGGDDWHERPMRLMNQVGATDRGTGPERGFHFERSEVTARRVIVSSMKSRSCPSAPRAY